MSTDFHQLELKGLRPEPLASYLSALGTLRLIAEGPDPEVGGKWRDGHFILETSLDADRLTKFFLEDYKPTPLVSPWNGGSGFYPKDNKDGISAISNSDGPRFDPYRETLATVRRLLDKLGLQEKPDGEIEKANLLKALRGTLSDHGLKWLDAALVLGEQDQKGRTRVRYAPILGTGGNDGRLEFSNNFMKRLEELFLSKKAKPDRNKELLEGLFFGTLTRHLLKVPVGQFDPGSAGGVNTTVGYEGPALVNPWSYILMVEGALLLAAGTTRRYRCTSRVGGAFPFTVSHLGAGHGKLGANEDNRQEIWLPLWEDRFVGLDELALLFSEGRAQNGIQQARNPIEFSLALASHGTSRGLSGFARFGFLQRNGKSYFATPLGYHNVGEREGASAIREMERWLTVFRGVLKAHSNQSQSLVTRYDSAALEYLKSNNPVAFTSVVERLGELSRYLSSTPKLREQLRPLPNLSAHWVNCCNSHTPEFRLALSLASLGGNRPHLRMRRHLEPCDQYANRWVEDGFIPRWVGRNLCERMLNTLLARLRTVEKLAQEADGVKVDSRLDPLWGPNSAVLADIEAFIEGRLDEERLERLFFGLGLVKPEHHRMEASSDAFLSLAFALPTVAMHRGVHWKGSERDARLPPPEIPRLLAAGKIEPALRSARRFLLSRPLSVPAEQVMRLEFPPHHAERLAAALLFPISDADYHHLVTRVLGIEVSEENNNEIGVTNV